MMAKHLFDPTILREYDIRGIVGTTLHAADARAVGGAFGTLLRRAGGETVCVGYDGRVSSPELEAACVEGLRSTGLEVRRIGRGPTPMLYYAVHETGADGGIHVTGSHNPPSHNGFKMMMGRKPFFGADIRALGAIAAAGDAVSGNGRVREAPVLAAYVDRLLRDAGGGRPLTVVWDAGNGATGEALARLTAALPGRHVLLYADIDGTFPNHHPDPTDPETLADLQAAVRREGADLGVAFDGDGDRLGVVDERGRILWGDQILQILAEDLLRRRPGATIIGDVKASRALFDEVARLGGVPLMWRTGHSLIKAKMAECGAPLAGEMSGHIFMAEGYYGFDDALYAAVRLLGVVAGWRDTTLGQRRDAMPQPLNTPEMRFDCPDARKFAVIDAVRDDLRRAGADFVDIDGVRVETPDGWWLLRASNTQAMLVARLEATDAAGLERLRAALTERLRRHGVAAPAMGV